MRLLRTLLWCVALGGLGIIVLLFLIQNLHAERLVFFGVVSTLNFAWVLVGAAAFGFLLALMLIVPGRIATALYARMLDRELRQLEQQVAHLSEQRERLLDGREQLLLRYERLYADRDNVIAERERLRAQLAAATAAQASHHGPDEYTPSTAAAERQPLALRARETRREVRAIPVAVAPMAEGERRAASAPGEDASTAARSSSRMLPPAAPGPTAMPAPMSIPAVPDPPAAPAAPATLSVTSVPPSASIPPPIAPTKPDPPAGAGRPGEAVAPPAESRPGQVRERIARHTAAAREQVGQWRGQAGRVRQSAGTRYNEMRTTLFVRARAVAGSARQYLTRVPAAPEPRDAAPADDRVSATSAAPIPEEGERENTMLKGEQPLWRPPE